MGKNFINNKYNNFNRNERWKLYFFYDAIYNFFFKHIYNIFFI